MGNKPISISTQFFWVTWVCPQVVLLYVPENHGSLTGAMMNHRIRERTPPAETAARSADAVGFQPGIWAVHVAEILGSCSANQDPPQITARVWAQMMAGCPHCNPKWTIIHWHPFEQKQKFMVECGESVHVGVPGVEPQKHLQGRLKCAGRFSWVLANT